jgi:RNA polymerase sigma-70 factor, ECF subfamily
VVKSKDSISDTLRAVHGTAAPPRPRSRIAQPHAISDEVLMAQIAGGDRSAMAALYARHHVRVFRFVLRLVQDVSTAEDLTTEVLFDVWRHANRFDRRSAVSTWVLGIARFKALSALRYRPTETLDEHAAEAIEDPADSPATEVEKKDTSMVIRKCLTELPAEHREIVDLVYYHEKSLEEVAEIVGIPKNTVKTRMFRARARLAGLLKRAGIERD